MENRKMRFFPKIMGWIFLLVVVVLPVSLAGQSQSGLPADNLTENELRGEGLFIQRCSLCHLPKRPQAKTPATVPSNGPSLNGVMKKANPNQEAVIRELILKGTPRMPGFQYGLAAKEMDELIAYLNTL